MDVTPRPPAPARPRRRVWALGAIVVLLAAAGFLLTQALTDATTYFYNADEAVDRRDELGDRRFRLQGTLVDIAQQTDESAAFTVSFRGVVVDVVHQGGQPALFEQGTPVVCEGRWDDAGRTFSSDRILVKHSEEYKAENPERVGRTDP